MYLGDGREQWGRQRMQNDTHPDVCPLPFCISTRMSQTRSPFCGSHLTLHQLRRPMIYLLFDEEPSGSRSKIGIYAAVKGVSGGC